MTDPAIVELYAVDPEAFVAARTALSKAIRAGGDRELAALVAKLRRPPVSAWALNQVARSSPDLLETLFAAARALGSALADPASADVRTAQRSFRAEFERVVRAALDLVSSSGRAESPGLQQAMQATLQAAAVDEGIADAVRNGVLAADEAAPGFLTGAGPVPVRAAKTPAKTPAKSPSKTPAKTPAKSPSKAPAPRAAVPPRPTFEERRLAKERERAEAAARMQERVRLAELTTNVERLTRRAARLERAAEQAEEVASAKRAEAADARREATAARAELDAHPTVEQ